MLRFTLHLLPPVLRPRFNEITATFYLTDAARKRESSDPQSGEFLQ